MVPRTNSTVTELAKALLISSADLAISSQIFGENRATSGGGMPRGRAGQTLQRFEAVQPVGEMPFSARFGVTTSCLIMGMVMIFISPFDELPVIRKPCASIFTKGLLLPVFGLHIVGLCNEADPLARLAARPVVSWAGKLALSMFLLALPMHVAIREMLGFDGFTLTFLASLLAVSVAGYFLIEVPSTLGCSW
eukprot:s1019_g4.t1